QARDPNGGTAPVSGSNLDVDHSILDAGRLLISDVDGTLLEGGKACNGCAALAAKLLDSDIGLVLATGRDLLLTRLAIHELASTGFPRPLALICSVGTEIYLG